MFHHSCENGGKILSIEKAPRQEGEDDSGCNSAFFKIINGFKDSVPTYKMHGCYKFTQKFRVTFHSCPSDIG